MKIKTLELARCALFSALMCISAWITVPSPVPFTLQSLVLMLSCALLGGRKATLSTALYIALGAVGLPVFSGFAGGIGVLFGASGGFIMGFVAVTLFMWAADGFAQRSTAALALSLAASLVILYAVGTVYYAFVYLRAEPASVGAVLAVTVLPFLIPDLIKLALAVILTKRLKKHLI